MANNEINNRINKAKTATKRVAMRTLWIVLIASIIGGAGYFAWRNYVVSEGTRTGVLYKISKKGIAFKTYEGELQLAGAQMMTNESIWKFSAKNEQLFKAMQLMEGKTVRCYYNERTDAFPWQGDTNYMVWKVEVVSDTVQDH